MGVLLEVQLAPRDEKRFAWPSELAVLSAIVHGARADGMRVVEAAVEAAAHLDDARAATYFDLIYTNLGELARAALEAVMAQGKWEYQSDFAKKYFAEGRVEAARRLLRTMLAARQVPLSERAIDAIEAENDADTLEQWTARAAVASSEDDVFGA